MKIALSLRSANKKTGPIPVAMSSKATCPVSCPLRNNGCYANSGALNVHWDRVTRGETGMPWAEFLAAIRALPEGQLWRYAQAGDLPGEGDAIDGEKLRELVAANRGRRGFTFTHKPLTPENTKLINYATLRGFTINLSANGLRHADELLGMTHAPVVALLSKHAELRPPATPYGEKVVICPALTHGKTCASCGLCAVSARTFVIGFIAHGSGRANGGEKVSRIAEQN